MECESMNQSASVPPSLNNRNEWIYRAVGAVVLVVLVWLAYRYRYDGMAVLLIAPFAIGALLAVLRLPAVSDALHRLENWFTRGRANAARSQGKWARFVKRPFFGCCGALWRWTAQVADMHLKAALRLTALIFVGVAVVGLAIMAAYILIVIAMIAIALSLIVGALYLWANSGSSGGKRTVTRNTTDWLGRPKQEHFVDGEKVGETVHDTDWLGRPKLVHKDAEGHKTGESKPDTDWLGNPIMVDRDADGNKVGTSRPDTDWLGNPITVHRDADGNVIAESRPDTDWLGRPQSVREEKQK